jgi:hypothetical protein
MNRTKLCLTLALAATVVLTAHAAPAPAPESQGPISDAQRLRGKVPSTAPPGSTRVTMIDENTLEVERVTYQYVAEIRTRTVEVQGKNVEVTETIGKAVPVTVQQRVPAKNVKFYTVTKDGKLDAIEAKKAAPLLKKPLAVLIGDKTEVDPRNLQIVKEGTLYLILPPPEPEALVPPPFAPPPAYPK